MPYRVRLSQIQFWAESCFIDFCWVRLESCWIILTRTSPWKNKVLSDVFGKFTYSYSVTTSLNDAGCLETKNVLSAKSTSNLFYKVLLVSQSALERHTRGSIRLVFFVMLLQCSVTVGGMGQRSLNLREELSGDEKMSQCSREGSRIWLAFVKRLQSKRGKSRLA